MAISLVGTPTDNAGGGSDTLSIASYNSTAAEILLGAAASFDGDNLALTNSFTFNSDAFTEDLDKQSSPFLHLSMHHLVPPDNTTATATVTFSASQAGGIAMGILGLTGINTSVPVSDSDFGNATGLTAALTLTTNSGDWVISSIVYRSTSAATAPGTERWRRRF